MFPYLEDEHAIESISDDFEAGDRWAPGWAAGVHSQWIETPKYQYQDN